MLKNQNIGIRKWFSAKRWKWFTGLLIGMIVLLVCIASVKIYQTNDPVIIMNTASYAAALMSIVFAFVAIIFSSVILSFYRNTIIKED